MIEICPFFDCIDEYAVSKYKSHDLGVVTDRLYKRYLRFEELTPCREIMQLIEDEFSHLDNHSSIDWESITSDRIKSKLNTNEKTLQGVFEKYFRVLYRLLKETPESYAQGMGYRTIMIGFTSIQYVSSYIAIPLSFFDALGPEDKPVWRTKKFPDFKNLKRI